MRQLRNAQPSCKHPTELIALVSVVYVHHRVLTKFQTLNCYFYVTVWTRFLIVMLDIFQKVLHVF